MAALVAMEANLLCRAAQPARFDSRCRQLLSRPFAALQLLPPLPTPGGTRACSRSDTDFATLYASLWILHQVMDSWRSILKGVRPRAFKITIEDVRVFASDTSGFVTCTEVVEADDSQGRWVGGTVVFQGCGGNWEGMGRVVRLPCHTHTQSVYVCVYSPMRACSNLFRHRAFACTPPLANRTIATNVFEKQDGKWVITHHHGSPLMRFR